MKSQSASYDRALRMDLPSGRSAFLWGARKTGKSTYLKTRFPESIRYDFLKTDVFVRLAKEPYRLREELLARPVSETLGRPIILDEVQKAPAVLDEVHWLIENKGMQFILCGSSARKLRHGHANMLGGRAWRFEMFPLTCREIPDFTLLKALNGGLLPSHYQEPNCRQSLKAYVQDYLKEEIAAEGLTRNMPAFARFLDAVGFSHGEMTNFSNIARDCGVDAKTVRGYYDILVDTLLGVFIPPFAVKGRRQLISSTSKFYLFDVGVAGFLAGRTVNEERGEEFGRAFEHFILMELLAHRAYSQTDCEIRFWRTKTGYEVDFILGRGATALEVKGKSRIDEADLRPIRAFVEEYKPRRAIVVCNEAVAREAAGVTVLPWREFLDRLWSGEIA